MGWIDLILGVLIVLAAVRGLRLGAVMQVASFVGFWAGLALGVAVALAVARPLVSGTSRTVTTLALVLGAGILFGIAGRVIGSWASQALRRWHLGSVDSGFGAVLGAASVLLSAWLIAGFMVQSPVGWLSKAFGDSAVMRTVDQVMPPVPSALSEVQGLLNSQGFPPVFAVVVPPASSRTATATSAAAEQIAAGARSSVVKVFGAGCGGYLEGSGFVVAPGVVVTNAHVVAGIRSPGLILSGSPVSARAVLVDPSLDLAVLRTTAPLGPALVLETALAPRGTPSAALGFPENGPFSAAPAAISAAFDAVGRNIYGGGLVTRQVYELTAQIQPGNSGGPLLGTDGHVLGVVFSRSTVDAGVGYALTAGAVSADVAKGEVATRTVSTGSCASG